MTEYNLQQFFHFLHFRSESFNLASRFLLFLCEVILQVLFKLGKSILYGILMVGVEFYIHEFQQGLPVQFEPLLLFILLTIDISSSVDSLG